MLAKAPSFLDREAAVRVLNDLLTEELKSLRPGGAASFGPGWGAETSVTAPRPGGIGADSLELLALATAVAQRFNLQDCGIEDYLLVRTTLGEWADLVIEGLRRGCRRLTFRTSGSTGAAKPCTHDISILEQEVDALEVLFAGRRRILSTVPSHHIYGFLFTVLLPRRLGIPVVDVRSRGPAALARIAEPGDLIVGFPSYWKLLPLSVRFAPDVEGTSSTAPLPAGTADALALCGLGRLVEIYGSSETGGVGWRLAPGSSFTLFPHWEQDPAVPDGLVRLDSRGRPERHLLSDHLDWLDARRFQVKGRRDGAVQVGGINVFPDRVAEILSRHPAVSEARVRLMRPEEGERLKAFIVPSAAEPEEELRASLTAWVDEHLSSPERPRAFAFGAALPVNAMGKAADW
ncbi:4-coumarate--CoA ligase [Azospirillum sp. SYSU D00513]|uniref:4-coumarate--CoA ligase n=1 Tax=Azospirillum sp. SYSU D00513 TaxID=2812561 RepID=UPI001A96C82C|nr:4-coumarate--CoA ligase [Azospirillum sp. SYSU D00513]